MLQHPDQPYGPNNPFVARYAFIAVPIGNALDLNAIYNDAIRDQRPNHEHDCRWQRLVLCAIKASVRGKSISPRFWRI